MYTEESEQYEFEFQVLSEQEDRDLSVLADIFMKHGNIRRLRAQAYTNELAAQGIPVFPVTVTNDTESTESDYGAPLYGLGNFSEFISPESAFRYTPIFEVEEALHSYFDKKMAIANQLKSEGYHIPHWHDPNMTASHLHFTNGGVTRAFSDIASYLIESFERMNHIASEHGRSQTGAILVPVPTYGLFVHQLEKLTEDTNVNIIYIHRNDNGAVNKLSLKTQLNECLLNNIRVIGYYDCNPNNPTGYIRDRHDTTETAKIIEEYTALQRKADQDFIDQCEKPHVPTTGEVAKLIRLSEEFDDQNIVCKTPAPTTKELALMSIYYFENASGRPVIMDDMAYEGLEIETHKKPYSFAQVSASIAEQTVVMKSVSKIGLPGIRTGLVIAESELLEQSIEKQLLEEFSANSFGVDILAARYGKHPKKRLFKAHQNKLRKAHHERFLYVQALLKGLDNVPELTLAQRQKLVRLYAKHLELSKTEAEQRLIRGLPCFHAQEKLESGFFLNINMEALKNKKVAVKYNDDVFPHLYTVNTPSILYWTLRAFKIKSVCASQQGIQNNSLWTRITLSMGEKDLFQFFDRMTKMHDFFFGKKPQVQMDLLRDYKPTL